MSIGNYGNQLLICCDVAILFQINNSNYLIQAFFEPMLAQCVTWPQ